MLHAQTLGGTCSEVVSLEFQRANAIKAIKMELRYPIKGYPVGSNKARVTIWLRNVGLEIRSE